MLSRLFRRTARRRWLELHPVLLGVVALGAWLVAPGCGSGGSFPSQPLTIICPWATGGGTDAVSRYLAAELGEHLGVEVNVVNRTGGEGVTGHSAGALARPDGYTLTLMTSELNMLHWRGLTSIDHHDFRLLFVLNRDAAALFVREDARWKTIHELVEEIRTRPGELTGSGTAKGGTWHLAFAGMLTALDLKPSSVRWIPTQGAAPSLQELVAGGLDMVTCSLPEAQSLLDSKRLRALAVMSDERLPEFPDVPTLKEQGIAWSMGGWRAIGVPKDTEDEVYDRLRSALREIVTGDVFLGRLRERGFGIAIEEGEIARRRLDEMDEAMGELLGSDEFSGIEKRRFPAMFFPSLLAGALALAATALAYGSWRERRERRVAKPGPVADGRPETPALPETPELARSGTSTRSSAWKLALPIGAIVLYVLLAEPLGFVLTTALIAFGYLVSLGNRILVSTLIAAVLSPLIYQLFCVGLGVPLPRGIFGW